MPEVFSILIVKLLILSDIFDMVSLICDLVDLICNTRENIGIHEVMVDVLVLIGNNIGQQVNIHYQVIHVLAIEVFNVLNFFNHQII